MSKFEKKRTLTADLSLFLVAAIWGSGFIATQYALDANMSASLVMTIRFSVATLILGMVFFPRLRNMTRKHWLWGAPAGVILFLAFFSQTVGLQYTTPSNNAFLTATNVVMVPFMAWAIHRRPPRMKAFILALVCLLGIGVLTYNPESGLSFNPGDLFTLLCAFLFAGHIAYLDVASKKVGAAPLTFIQMAISALFSFITLLFIGKEAVVGANLAQGLLPAIYLGMFSTCLCFLIQTAAQRHTTSSKAALYLSTEALFGTTFSILVGLEPLTSSMMIGGVMIMGTIVLSEVEFPWTKSKQSQNLPNKI
ncbi:MAG: DMT family transporter [Spirochaetales bacterium]|nr:DMT family transporter [Spirochaetales bacterium]